MRAGEGHHAWSGGVKLQLLTVPIIYESLAAQPITLCCQGWSWRTLLMKSPMSIDVLILLGFTTGRFSRGPVAIETRLGWVLSGPVPTLKGEQAAPSLITTHTLQVDAQEASTNRSLDKILKAFYQRV